MQMEIFKIEKQQSIHKVLEKKSKASRPVTELSENPFLPSFSIIYFTVPQLKILGLHKFSFSHRLEYLNVASGSFPNLLISLEVRTLFSLHQTFENITHLDATCCIVKS
jgi:hypothetical protein